MAKKQVNFQARILGKLGNDPGPDGCGSREACFHPCLCLEMTRLAGGQPRRSIRTELREARRQDARLIGWSTLRGRGQRARTLAPGISAECVAWDRRAVVQAEIHAAAEWVGHLREHRIRTREDLIRHLRKDVKIVWFKPPDLFDVVLDQIRDVLRSECYRRSQVLGIRVLTALRGYRSQDTLKKQLLKRYVLVRYVRHDLNALIEVATSRLGVGRVDWKIS